MKNFIQQNKLSIVIGIFLSILMIFIFNNQESFSGRFRFLTGVILSLLLATSFIPKMRGIILPFIVLFYCLQLMVFCFSFFV